MGSPGDMELLERPVRRLEALDALDGPATAVTTAVGRLSHRQGVREALSGTPLGHPLHPVLTDLPIGSWTSAFVLDLVGGRSGRRAAQTLVGLGVATALPTALTGLADWADTVGGTRRIGAAHAVGNTVALGLYALSWRSRRRGRHGRGIVLGMAGAAAATAAAYLGGHLVYRTGTGVDVNAATVPPVEPTAAEVERPLEGVEGAYLRAGPLEVVATKRSGRWRGIGARCSHRGGPLQDGTFEDDCVTCPWHASRFDLEDGAVRAGPAVAPQPCYRVEPGPAGAMTVSAVS